MRHVDDLPEIDFASPEYQAAPFKMLADCARRWKIARSERGVELLDYDLCRHAIVDRKLGTGHPKLMDVLGLPEGRALDYKRASISYHNRGPRRRNLRIPVTKLMGPDASERFRKDIKHVITRVVDAIPTDTSVDLVTHLCDPIPSAVYCYWTGAPFDYASYVARTSHTVQQVHTRNPEHTKDIVKAFESLLDFVDERIKERRVDMKDDLLSDLIRATDAGQLSESDLRNWVVKLAEANTDNSSHQIGIALIELASRPDVWARLGADATLVPAAVREVMRFHPRSISTSREVMEDMEIEGTLLPKGTPVFANIGAAHWDARHYADPEMFDIDRVDEPPHLNFGGGIFSCVGRYAVTMEVEEVIALLAQRHPNLTLKKTGFSHSPLFTSISELDVVLNPS
ncbi:MAG: cytochrome P450 [Litoreibacter sp.]|uniref:cytochrome P450 n=1 Tax=Litoreibacter sp. TaxID=1969459 RepID=UPI00329A69E0